MVGTQDLGRYLGKVPLSKSSYSYVADFYAGQTPSPGLKIPARAPRHWPRVSSGVLGTQSPDSSY